MSSETPTDPGGVPIPSSTGIVGKAGKQPDSLAPLKEIAHQAVVAVGEQWEKKSTRDTVATLLYFVIGKLLPGAAQSILLTNLKPAITALIETGSK